MAKFIWIDPRQMWSYALDFPEDYLVINAYWNIKQSGKFEASRTIKTFEYYHLKEGGTLNDQVLLQINDYLRQLGLPLIQFVNGHTTSYAAMRGQEKILARQNILQQLQALSDDQREALITKKENEAALLPERNPDLPVYRPAVVEGDLQRPEIERRRQALALAQQRDVAYDPSASEQPMTACQNPTPNIEQLEFDGVDQDETGAESALHDAVAELLSEVVALREEVAASRQETAALITMMQTIFRMPAPRRATAAKVKRGE